MNKINFFIIQIAIMSSAIVQASGAEPFNLRIIATLNSPERGDSAIEALLAAYNSANANYSPLSTRFSGGTNERPSPISKNNSPVSNQSFPSPSEALANEYTKRCRKEASENAAYALECLEREAVRTMTAAARRGFDALIGMVENAQNPTSREERKKIKRDSKEQKRMDLLARADFISKEKNARKDLSESENFLMSSIETKFNKRMRRLNRRLNQ